MACLLKGVDGHSLQADLLLESSVMVDFARPPKALQALSRIEASGPLRVNCWIFARRWQGKSKTVLIRVFLVVDLRMLPGGFEAPFYH